MVKLLPHVCGTYWNSPMYYIICLQEKVLLLEGWENTLKMSALNEVQLSKTYQCEDGEWFAYNHYSTHLVQTRGTKKKGFGIY